MMIMDLFNDWLIKTGGKSNNSTTRLGKYSNIYRCSAGSHGAVDVVGETIHFSFSTMAVDWDRVCFILELVGGCINFLRLGLLLHPFRTLLVSFGCTPRGHRTLWPTRAGNPMGGG